jgi:signal recognition particle subunit SRP54
LEQVIAIGGLKGIMGMLPGVQKLKGQISEAQLEDRQVRRQIGIIRSMTRDERRKPDILNSSRRKRIASGAGVEVADVNRLIKMHRNMADMAKAMGKGRLPAAFGGGRMPNPEALKQLGGGKLPQAPSASGALPGLPGGLPGLPGGKKN